MRSLRVLALKEEALFPRENRVAGLVTEKVTALVADDRGGDQRGNEHINIHDVLAGGGFERRRHHAGDEQQRVARQEESDQQARLRKNDRRNDRYATGADHFLQMAAVVKVLEKFDEECRAWGKSAAGRSRKEGGYPQGKWGGRQVPP